MKKQFYNDTQWFKMAEAYADFTNNKANHAAINSTRTIFLECQLLFF